MSKAAQGSTRKTQKDREAVKPKKERAVFDLPGQLREAPEENEPLRIFYESLYNQIPESEMAQIWMMEHGLLDEDEARRVLVIKQRRGGGRGGAAATPASARAATAVRASSAAASAAASRASATALGSKPGSAAGGKAQAKSPASATKVEPSSNGRARGGAKTPTSGGRKAAVKAYRDESDSEEEIIPLKKLRR
ncbi:hypothetical protein CLOP_g9510 [Closterium sp. NIES-67]|nr:hypothetical protein CLOP_g18214 [Closterium sp. NIES-67]GJP79257.1 hypothetical protein CLOP_g9510 [Closterium sp. NIES-67]